jgi:peptidyl-prolyl cis-trans isomerase SDCCAG10
LWGLAAFRESQKTELEKMEEAVRKIARRHSDSESGDDEREAKRPKGPSQLELELSKYKKGRTTSSKKGKGKGRDEGDLLAALSSFRGRLQRSLGETEEDHNEDGRMKETSAGEDKMKEAGGQDEDILREVDDDSSWIGHRLKFAKDDGAETRRAEHEYVSQILLSLLAIG